MGQLHYTKNVESTEGASLRSGVVAKYIYWPFSVQSTVKEQSKSKNATCNMVKVIAARATVGSLLMAATRYKSSPVQYNYSDAQQCRVYGSFQ